MDGSAASIANPKASFHFHYVTKFCHCGYFHTCHLASSDMLLMFSVGTCLVFVASMNARCLHSMVMHGAWWYNTCAVYHVLRNPQAFCPPFLHTASNQELKEGEAWEWGYLKTTFTDYQSASIILRTLMRVHRLTVMMEMWRPQWSSAQQNW